MDLKKEIISATASFGIELADLPHEINNVLTLGIGHFGSLKNQVEKGLPDIEKTNRSLMRLDESLKRLKLISERIREVRSRNAFETVSVDLSRVSKNWVNVSKPSFSSMGLELSFDPPQEEIIVETRMADLVSALTGSALHFLSLENSKINVGVGVLKDKPSITFGVERLPTTTTKNFLVIANGVAHLDPTAV